MDYSRRLSLSFGQNYVDKILRRRNDDDLFEVILRRHFIGGICRTKEKLHDFQRIFSEILSNGAVHC